MMKREGGSRWTWFLWGGAALLLSLPFVAMRLTSEVNWSLGDFLVMGALLAAVCGIIEVAARRGGSLAYKLGVMAAVGASFLIIWINLAVGHEHAPYDLPFYLALLVGIVGSAIARFRPKGMMAAMLATAVALVVALRLAMVHEADAEGGNLLVTALASAMIASPFLLSAWLFRRAARTRKKADRMALRLLPVTPVVIVTRRRPEAGSLRPRRPRAARSRGPRPSRCNWRRRKRG
jgi:hypothetical protein